MLKLLFAMLFSFPVIGAQVFVEPGQSAADIDEYFSVLEQSHMRVARIRLFGVHVCKNGDWDFCLYDQAFDAAQRHNVKLFVTLFPPTDELTDLGGFKFPRSKEHLAQIDEYVRRCVEHYKNHPALLKWVLQNEPGTEMAAVEPTDLSEQIRKEWFSSLKPSPYDNGYLKADFSNEKFLVYYTTWYLSHISDIVTSIDPIHGRHVNPHQIMRTLPEYDFEAFSRFLTSVGASFHMSWHFDLFNKDEYPLGVSLMSDIIRSAATPLPFWVTEMQGGNTTSSGFVPYCPTGAHVSQYLWTSIASGARGVLFWSLNPRASAMEAGDWGLLDYQRKPSDRMMAASSVAACIEENASLFESATPLASNVTILYNLESIRIQRHNSSLRSCPEMGRRADAVMVSLQVAYKALLAGGITPVVQDMSRFDWTAAAREGRCVVLPHCVALPSWEWDNIRNFVREGGKLIVTGLTGYFDENMHCLFMDRPQPLADCFGGDIREFKVVSETFPFAWGMDAHLWRGTIVPSSDSVVLMKAGADGMWNEDEPVAMRHAYGRGEVVWVPSPIELGSYHNPDSMKALEEFYAKECAAAFSNAPVRLASADDSLLIRSMKTAEGILLVIVNKAESERTARLEGRFFEKSPVSFNVLFGSAKVRNRNITIPSEGCVVLHLK